MSTLSSENFPIITNQEVGISNIEGAYIHKWIRTDSKEEDMALLRYAVRFFLVSFVLQEATLF